MDKLTYLIILKHLNIKDADYFSERIDEAVKFYNITNKENILFFIANIIHESFNLTKFKENLYYTTEINLKKAYKSIFINMGDKYKAQDYLRNPEKLASIVYDDRIVNKNLGNLRDGYAEKFIGRGAIQVTGFYNYKKISDYTKINFVDNPKLLEDKKYAILGSMTFWYFNNIHNVKTLKDSRKKVAGSLFGLDKVEEIYKKIKEVV